MTFDTNCKFSVSYVFSTKNRLESAKKNLIELSKNITNDDELVFINGGIEGGLKKFINELSIKNFKYVNETDYSDLHAWNKSFLLAEGQIIKNICDDDDYNWPNLKKSIDLLKSDPELDCILTGGLKINTQNNCETFINVPNSLQKWHSNLENLFKYSTSGTGLIFKRRLLAKIGQLWLMPSNEINFLLSCFKNKNVKIRYLRSNTYTHRYSQDSISFKRAAILKKYMLRKCRENCSYFFFLKMLIKQSSLAPFIKRLLFIKPNSKNELNNFDWKLL